MPAFFYAKLHPSHVAPDMLPDVVAGPMRMGLEPIGLKELLQVAQEAL